MEIKDIIKEIMDHIGNKGVVAGGAVRDLVLGHIPKDFDVFIFYEQDFRRIVKHSIFDTQPQKTERPFEVDYPSTFEVYNTTLHGYPVQLIWNDHVEETFGNNMWKDGKWVIKKRSITGKHIIDCFDFTINMMYMDRSGKTFITNEAQRAINQRAISFNPQHHSGLSSESGTAKFLIKRMIYLACKLNFVVAPNTIQQILDMYDNSCVLENVQWE